MDRTLLSTPSKMPGFSFSLPAGRACPASKATIVMYGDKATCASCYALAGNYRFANVKDAQARRFDFVRKSIRGDGGKAFVREMIETIDRATKGKERIFRIHDAGDFFSPEYVGCWIKIAKALPDVHFWAPTREYVRTSMRKSLRKLGRLPNVTVRPSAVEVNTPAPEGRWVNGLSAGSAVYASADDVPKGTYICPATATDKHACDDHGCRACWFAKTTPVAYIAHGQKWRSVSRKLPVLEG
jgi:hypothetical protein